MVSGAAFEKSRAGAFEMVQSIWQRGTGQRCIGLWCTEQRVDKSDCDQLRWKPMFVFLSIVLVLSVAQPGSAQEPEEASGAVGSLYQGQQGNAGGQSRPLVLAHYMPWYEAKPLSQNWGWHWTMNHFDPERIERGRRSIASNYYPLIGP